MLAIITVVTYTDPNGFLVQAPPLPREDLRGQRDWPVQCYSLGSLIADTDANYLHTMLPRWSMAWVLILETQAKFWWGIPLQPATQWTTPQRACWDFHCLLLTWLPGVEWHSQDQHPAEWWGQDGTVVNSHSLVPDWLDSNPGPFFFYHAVWSWTNYSTPLSLKLFTSKHGE